MTSSNSDHQTEAGPSGVNRHELVESIVVALFALALLGVTFTFQEVPPILAQGIGPAVFPRAVLILMLFLAILQGINAIRPARPGRPWRKAPKPIPPIVYLTAGVLILFLVGLMIIGTFPTLILFCFGLSFLWGERRWKIMVPSFAAFAGFIYVLFVYLLGANLP